MDKGRQLSYNDLRQKYVISLSDGKNLGKISDAVISYPENKIKGYFVSDRRWLCFAKNEIYVSVSNIVKIGEDAILCDLEHKDEKPQKCKIPCCKPPDRRNYDEYD